MGCLLAKPCPQGERKRPMRRVEGRRHCGSTKLAPPRLTAPSSTHAADLSPAASPGRLQQPCLHACMSACQRQPEPDHRQGQRQPRQRTAQQAPPAAPPLAKRRKQRGEDGAEHAAGAEAAADPLLVQAARSQRWCSPCRRCRLPRRSARMPPAVHPVPPASLLPDVQARIVTEVEQEAVRRYRECRLKALKTRGRQGGSTAQHASIKIARSCAAAAAAASPLRVKTAEKNCPQHAAGLHALKVSSIFRSLGSAAGRAANGATTNNYKHTSKKVHRVSTGANAKLPARKTRNFCSLGAAARAGRADREDA